MTSQHSTSQHECGRIPALVGAILAVQLLCVLIEDSGCPAAAPSFNSWQLQSRGVVRIHSCCCTPAWSVMDLYSALMVCCGSPAASKASLLRPSWPKLSAPPAAGGVGHSMRQMCHSKPAGVACLCQGAPKCCALCHVACAGCDAWEARHTFVRAATSAGFCQCWQQLLQVRINKAQVSTAAGFMAWCAGSSRPAWHAVGVAALNPAEQLSGPSTSAEDTPAACQLPTHSLLCCWHAAFRF